VFGANSFFCAFFLVRSSVLATMGLESKAYDFVSLESRVYDFVFVLHG
jgi:hypothetical protein